VPVSFFCNIFLARFWAFLDKGSSKTRGGISSAFPRNSPYFRDFFLFFLSTFCCCVG
jgi:hypothetical protein